MQRNIRWSVKLCVVIYSSNTTRVKNPPKFAKSKNQTLQSSVLFMQYTLILLWFNRIMQTLYCIIVSKKVGSVVMQRCIILVLYQYYISIILVLYCITVSKKVGSDVIEKIARSREERHESALDEMHQELLLISSVSLSTTDYVPVCVIT